MGGIPSVRNEPILEDDEEKNWLNGGIHNFGSTFDSAPYNSAQFNGFRQVLPLRKINNELKDSKKGILNFYK